MPVIYKITSPSGKVYIGQSWDWIKRKSVYKRLACAGQRKLYNSLVKYGYDNHEIQVICELPKDVSQDVLNSYEEIYLKQYIDCNVPILNIREAGSNGKLSKETIEKMSKSLRGRTIKPESIAKMLETRKNSGYVMSEESRRKIGDAHRRMKLSMEAREKIRQANLGKKMHENTKKAIVKANKGRKCSEETKRRIGDKNLGSKNGMFGKKGVLCYSSKKVINTSNGQIYNSITEAEVLNGINKGVLVNKLNGRTKNNTSFTYYNESHY